MTDDELEPMDPALAELLRRGAPPVDAPPDVVARAHARLAQAIAAPRPGGEPAREASRAPGPGGGAVAGVAALGRSRGLLGALLVGLAAGGAAGVALTRRLSPAPVERVVYVDRVVAPPTPPAPPRDAVPDPRVGTAAPPSAAVGTPAPASSLLVERKLIDAARADFTAGDYPGCLARLDDHARRHPDGRLAEEREALAVRALAALGRRVEARERGERFLRARPDSLMGPVVQDVVRGL